jgi:hypothetical protein
MKTKQTVSGKKQSIVVKDLKAKKNPKGGGVIACVSGKHFPLLGQPTTESLGYIK